MTVIENAYAKINLFLDVTGKRSDGFHEIKSIMQTVSLVDELEVTAELSDETKIHLLVTVGEELFSLGITPETLGASEDNLVYKAAMLYLDKAALTARIEASLNKRIPVAAGLAGGSADAAAMLRALNKFFGRFSDSELSAIGAELGSDVPFCLNGGTAFCTGRGEKLVNLSYTPDLCIVVAIGKARISTKSAYAALDNAFSDFDGSVKSPGDKMTSGNIGASGAESPRACADESEKKRADRITHHPEECAFNIFEYSGLPEMAEVEKIKDDLRALGATATLMSGSGPSVFGIFETKSKAELAVGKLRGEGIFAVCVNTVRY